ncbi:MAG: FliA/WhiG family RNA polymerase sigma factor [Candidatus Sericytochromatia bacterium]|nr:FliA/WhiG family RNA polymerase sigma factor [Candidatus Sericytochromatia bacterium]
MCTPSRPGKAALQSWWQAHAAGDVAARHHLITHYLYLVKYAVGRMLVQLPAHIDAEDLSGYGLMGLIQSVDKFEPARGARFESFAMLRIRGAILDQLRAMDWMPRSLRQKAKAIEQAIQTIEQRSGQPADEAAIAAELGISPEALQQQLADTAFLVLSLDYLLQPDSDETLKDSLADPGLLPEEQAERQLTREALAQALASLPAREQQLMSLYYFEGLTLKEIGSLLGLTEARICQLHSQCLHRLRARLQ